MNTNTIRENFKRGTIDLLLLFLLRDEEKYGYQLRNELAEQSDGKYVLKETTLYPTLYRLVDNGYLKDKTIKTGKRRTRNYYYITEAGMDYLQELLNEYQTMTEGIQNILNYPSSAHQ